MKKILIVLSILLSACSKETINKLTSLSIDNEGKRDYIPPGKQLFLIGFDSDYAYQKQVYEKGRPIIYTEAGKTDTMRKLLTGMSTDNEIPITDRKHVSRSQSQVKGWRVKQASDGYIMVGLSATSVDNDTAIIISGYQYHYVFNHDYNFPATNYRVTLYWNVDAWGHPINAAIKTEVWGFGNYNSYTESKFPAPYITIDPLKQTIQWDAFGSTNIGFDLGFGVVSGLNFTADIPQEFIGWIQLTAAGDAASSGYSHVIGGVHNTTNKSSTTHPMQ